MVWFVDFIHSVIAFWFVAPRTPFLWQRDFFLVNCLGLRSLLASVRSGVAKTFRCASLMQSIPEIIAAVDDQVVVQAHLVRTSSPEPITAANDAVSAVDLKPIGDKWRAIPTPPIDLLAYHIGHDLAYSSQQLLPVERCQAIANAFAAIADDDSRWFTNNTERTIHPDGSSGYGCCPVSDWTFDAAFVAVGARNTLVICFLAED